MIAITGASGFVGKNLIKFYNSFGIDYKAIKARLDTIKFDAFEADTIVHLSGKAHDLKNVSNPEDYYQANTELTKKLYDIFLKSNSKIFIMLSSVKAVRDSLEEEILTEDTTPDPKTNYGLSKLMAEEYILSRPIPEGKKVYILRPCMIHGPGNKGNLNLLYRVVSLGVPYPLAAFDNKRSYLTIANLCYVINELCCNSDMIPSGIYNIADDVPLSTNDVVKIISKCLNKRSKLLSFNQSIIKGIARMGDIVKLPLNTERLQKLTENYVVSNKKILSFLNRPLPVSSEDGLQITIQSFKNKI
jgi:nucleoside-diphosphate-sugar epimerase